MPTASSSTARRIASTSTARIVAAALTAAGSMAGALPATAQQLASADGPMTIGDAYRLGKERCAARAQQGDAWAAKNPLQCAEDERGNIAKEYAARVAPGIACLDRLIAGNRDGTLPKAVVMTTDPVVQSPDKKVTAFNACAAEEAAKRLMALRQRADAGALAPKQ